MYHCRKPEIYENETLVRGTVEDVHGLDVQVSNLEVVQQSEFAFQGFALLFRDLAINLQPSCAFFHRKLDAVLVDHNIKPAMLHVLGSDSQTAGYLQKAVLLQDGGQK